jgi:hypothetical protein
MASTAWTATARKRWACDTRGVYCRGIRPGDEYVRAVAFPGHDANDGPGPWVMRSCLGCYAPPQPPRRRRPARQLAFRLPKP